MAHHLLSYTLAHDSLARRLEHRDAHLALAWETVEAGHLLFGGAGGDPVESALLLFDDADAAAAFAARDPYVREGPVTAWRVLPWSIVVGAGAAMPVRPA